MKTLKVFTVDAFTSIPFEGNPAGVVLHGDDLTGEEMSLIAKEINLSETAFVLTSHHPEASFKIRYFTPTLEIDFCGHATVASSWVILSKDLIDRGETLVLETNIGLIPIDYDFSERLNQVIMTQVEPQVRDIEYDENELCELLGIDALDIDHRCPIKLAYTGNWDLLIPIKSRKAIDEAKPNFEALKNHNLKHKLASTHLFTFDCEDALLYTRDFSPSSGINEDPVTGSANGALAGYLKLEGIVDETEYTIIQGNSLNRRGELSVRVNEMRNHIQVQIGGSAVIMFEGVLKLK
jgi:trans-2,3-dihydro-3-hydroxyanthranilate isomerase